MTRDRPHVDTSPAHTRDDRIDPDTTIPDRPLDAVRRMRVPIHAGHPLFDMLRALPTQPVVHTSGEHTMSPYSVPTVINRLSELEKVDLAVEALERWSRDDRTRRHAVILESTSRYDNSA